MVSAKLPLALLAASYVAAKSFPGDVSIIAHEGEPIGEEVEVDGGELSLSLPEPFLGGVFSPSM